MDFPTDRQLSSAPVTAFIERIADFLNRWGLISLYDWHLPMPQGPLLPSHLPSGAPAEPRQGVWIILPLHYPLQGDDDLLKEIARLQRRNAVDLGLPAGLWPVKHVKQQARFIHLIHLETVLRSRFDGKPPRGFVGMVEHATADHLGVELGTVQRLRKWVTKCRAGNRNSIPRLRD